MSGETSAIELLQKLDPQWTESYARMATSPWTNGSLPAKEVQLISIGLSAAVTNLDASALRRHLHAALHAGATQMEILEVLKMAAMLSLHSMSLGAPILIEEAKAAGRSDVAEARAGPTPFCDRMKAIGQWNDAWNPFFELDPHWTEQFVAAGAGFYTNGVLTPKFVELISIAFDASITHMYAPGTRRHIRAAFALGASGGEILDVLKICVAQGANALDLAVPLLAEEAQAFCVGGDGAPEYVEAIDLAELAPGTATTVTVNGKRIALFNRDGEIFATDDVCPHAGSSLGWGVFEDKTIKCRAHGLRFDVTTGEIVGRSGLAIATYPTRVDGGKVLLAVS